MELMLFTCARSIHINTDRKELKQVLHFRFKTEVDKSLFLAPPLRTTSCNVHYSGPILYDNERETWSKSICNMATCAVNIIHFNNFECAFCTFIRPNQEQL
jgi:hypothetical protein